MTDNEFIKMEADDRPILWSDIKGYEGFYRVSTDGQVQSVERVREYLNASFTEQELSYNTIRNRCHDMSFTPYHGRWWFNTTDWNDNVKGEIIRKHINYKHSAL